VFGREPQEREAKARWLFRGSFGSRGSSVGAQLSLRDGDKLIWMRGLLKRLTSRSTEAAAQGFGRGLMEPIAGGAVSAAVGELLRHRGLVGHDLEQCRNRAD